MRVAANPSLYDPSPDIPVLHGVQCDHCARVYFPPMGIGCEMCGARAEQLLPTLLLAQGVVHAVAEVNLSPAAMPTPFTIAEIALDGGPLIRAMVHPESPGLQIGDRVVARWNVVKHNDEGAEVVEPGFMAAVSSNGVQP
ncbi:MAG TPA: zinc ribbon domain-containing protein [Mycobacterium sp.]|jgi:uncharacterized OB-fold protein|nr:zinc ribbon domain-containing protein [Mycobacterium sp.]